MKTQREDLPGVALWLAGLDGVEEGEWPVLYAGLSPARQVRCDRYRREADRRRCILAGALARRALSEASGRPPEDISFQLRPEGKPFAPGLGWEFSLSHSGSLVLCAVSRQDVGADLQRRQAVSPALLERSARRGRGEEDFFAWWTRQEAAGKLTGRGLSLAPLPEGLRFQSGQLERPDGQYVWCVCQKGLSFSGEP